MTGDALLNAAPVQGILLGRMRHHYLIQVAWAWLPAKAWARRPRCERSICVSFPWNDPGDEDQSSGAVALETPLSLAPTSPHQQDAVAASSHTCPHPPHLTCQLLLSSLLMLSACWLVRPWHWTSWPGHRADLCVQEDFLPCWRLDLLLTLLLPGLFPDLCCIHLSCPAWPEMTHFANTLLLSGPFPCVLSGLCFLSCLCFPHNWSSLSSCSGYLKGFLVQEEGPLTTALGELGFLCSSSLTLCN